jgi:iron-sulfur cluster repair protein YtfE (RIC family)
MMAYSKSVKRPSSKSDSHTFPKIKANQSTLEMSIKELEDQHQHHQKAVQNIASSIGQLPEDTPF